MLKNKFWIVALFAALTMAFFGCTNLADGLDDGSGPLPAEDLVLEGSKIVLASVGNTSSLINGTKVTILGGTSTGFYIQLPDEGVDNYPNVIVYMKVDNVVRGRPGLLMKTTTQLNANVGGVGNDDDSYQLNDVGVDEGTEFNTGLQKANQFTANRFVFQHQAWQPGNNEDAEYTIEVVKVVFPGSGGTVDTGYPPMIYRPTSGSATATGNIFYVNLNDKRDGVGMTASPVDIPTDPVPVELAADEVKLTFTKENQRAFFKLTGEQAAFLMEADSLKITLDATKTGTFTFRYGLADPLETGTWNATSLPTSINGTEEPVTFSSKTEKKVAYFVIQARGAGTETVLTIESIKIETVKKEFGGLSIVVSPVSTGTPAAEVGSYLSASYTGNENPKYTWTRGTTVISNEKTIYVSKAVITSYTVTISLYGYVSKTATFDDYDIRVSLEVLFQGGTAGSGKAVVTGALGGTGGALAVTGGGESTVTFEADGSGFTFVYGSDGACAWEQTYTVFELPKTITTGLANGVVAPFDITMFTKVDLVYTRVSDGPSQDSNHKTVNLFASSSAFGVALNDSSLSNALLGGKGTGDVGDLGDSTPVLTIDINGNNLAAAATGTTVYFALHANANNGMGYKITGLKFYN